MSQNVLYIYDSETNSAVSIADGFSNGWLASSGIHKLQNAFFDSAIEYPGEADFKTRYVLMTNDNLPKDCSLFQSGDSYAHRNPS